MTEGIYRQIGCPIFQNKVYPTRAAAEGARLGDVVLVQDDSTGLVRNAAFAADRLDYDADYQNEQACSAAFLSHLAQVMEVVSRHVSKDEHGIEVGCGKGFFLERLLAAGFDTTGYDPAYEGENPRVMREYFGEAHRTLAPRYVVLRHVLEHIEAPFDFLARLASHCPSGARIYIEVPCFDWIVAHEAFYDIFYEHVNYFTLDVLTSAFGTVLEAGRLFGGQYLYVVADLSTFRPPPRYVGKRFGPLGIERYLDKLLGRLRGPLERSLIWGAGAKGITFANALQQRGETLPRAIIDINPAKQGCFAGLSGLPILSPRDAASLFSGADIFVMNPVYFDEIKTMAHEADVNWISVALYGSDQAVR